MVFGRMIAGEIRAGQIQIPRPYEAGTGYRSGGGRISSLLCERRGRASGNHECAMRAVEDPRLLGDVTEDGAGGVGGVVASDWDARAVDASAERGVCAAGGDGDARRGIQFLSGAFGCFAFGADDCCGFHVWNLLGKE